MKHTILEQMEYPFQAWTDYPMKKSEEGKTAPIRMVTVVSYDGNKYCKVIYKGKGYAVKSGYIYPWPTDFMGYKP